MDNTIKQTPDDENEVHDLVNFRDPARNRVTAIAQFSPTVALAIVETLQAVVLRAHSAQAATRPSEEGIVRAQVFEEGHVYMSSAPFDGFFADRYLMDFYDVKERDICSRMHLHTGLRFVRMMTGPETVIRISSLSQFEIVHVEGVTPFRLESLVDVLPGTPMNEDRDRFSLIVPANSWVDMQIPRGVSHQFNAIGPNAVIDSVHPEESIETFRESMSGYRMMAQTVFLAEELPPSDTCIVY